MIKKFLLRTPVLFTLTTLLTISPTWAMLHEDEGAGGHAVAVTLPEVPQIAWRDITKGHKLGEGSFGKVYAGKWKGQDVAIKELEMRTLPTPQIRREFDGEARTIWICQFPRVTRLFGVCTEPGHCAMIFERMQRSLYDWIHDEDIPEQEREQRRFRIATDIAQGLASLHARNVLHRDLKSENILLDRRGRAKISDFGSAKIRTATMTMTRQTRGTIRWSAPEVLELIPRFTAASDMYSYGMVLWELLTRKTPFSAQPNEQPIIAAIASGKREDIPASCPPLWRKIIEDCWEHDPSHRPTAQAVLKRFMDSRPIVRPVWLPEEEPDPSTIREAGYVCYPASRRDWEKVLQCYQQHPVPGYDVGRVEVIFNPAMNTGFLSTKQLLQRQHGNTFFVANWMEQEQSDLRALLMIQLEMAAENYQEDDSPDVKLVPLWHGTQKDKLASILSTGYRPRGDTDDGYFGRGLYGSLEAAYAQMYADQFASMRMENGVLVLNWGITYASHPILRQDYDPIQKKLAVRIPPGTYDSHFIPVVPGANPVDYVPITPPERHLYTEMAFCGVTAHSQVLPRYLITLEAKLLAEPNSQELMMQSALREKEEREQAGKERAQRLAAHEEEVTRRRAETDALTLQLTTVRQERDAFAQQKDALAHQLTLMFAEQNRMKQENGVLAQHVAALEARLAAFELTRPAAE